MTQRCGDTLLFRTPPVIAAQAAVGGKKEGEGPLAAAFDELSSDNRFGQSSWEAAEKYLQLRAARLCLQKAQLPEEKVRLVLAGDLQAQCTASGYAMRELGVPFAGVFGACSTMAETLGLGAALCASGAAEHLLAMASSHFCAAERQFRTPLSYGAVRTPTAQWTATAAGCCLLQPAGRGVGIAAATFGRVQDYQVKDINNMGAAMAPAAASTLLHYFADTHTEPQEFDCIYTGDLGQVGSSLLRELLAGIEEQGVHARVFRSCASADLAAIAHTAAKLSGSGIGVGILSRGTTMIHQKDLVRLSNLELFPQAPLMDADTFREVGRNAARYAKGESPEPVPARNDHMARPRWQAKAALLHIKESEFARPGHAPVELDVSISRAAAR